MKLSGVLVLVCVVTCGLFTSLVAPETTGAVFLGMAAPLVMGLGTIRLVEHTARTDMPALTGRLAMAFIVKLVFYAAYVVAVVALLEVDPLPFIISLTLYFVALHFTEALYFKRLFAQHAANTTARHG